MPEFFQVAYAARTLQQLLYLRRELQWRSSRVDCMLAALVLGSLHGESERSPSYLSNQMPRTISTKPSYSVRFWREHGHHAPEREVFGFLRNRVDFRYESIPPDLRAKAFECDFRDLPDHLIQAKPQARRHVASLSGYDELRRRSVAQAVVLRQTTKADVLRAFEGRSSRESRILLAARGGHVADARPRAGAALARGHSHGRQEAQPRGDHRRSHREQLFLRAEGRADPFRGEPTSQAPDSRIQTRRPRWRLRSGLLLFCCLLAYGTALSS